MGDTPCQWCEHGTKLTCNDINYCTSTTVDNTDKIKIRATSSTGLEDSIVGSINPTTATSIMKDGTGEKVSLETSGMIDEYFDSTGRHAYTVMKLSDGRKIIADLVYDLPFIQFVNGSRTIIKDFILASFIQIDYRVIVEVCP